MIPELLMMVFQQLPGRTLARYRPVSTHWHAVLIDEILTKKIEAAATIVWGEKILSERIKPTSPCYADALLSRVQGEFETEDDLARVTWEEAKKAADAGKNYLARARRLVTVLEVEMFFALDGAQITAKKLIILFKILKQDTQFTLYLEFAKCMAKMNREHGIIQFNEIDRLFNPTANVEMADAFLKELIVCDPKECEKKLQIIRDKIPLILDPRMKMPHFINVAKVEMIFDKKAMKMTLQQAHEVVPLIQNDLERAFFLLLLAELEGEISLKWACETIKQAEAIICLLDDKDRVADILGTKLRIVFKIDKAMAKTCLTEFKNAISETSGDGFNLQHLFYYLTLLEYEPYLDPSSVKQTLIHFKRLLSAKYRALKDETQIKSVFQDLIIGMVAAEALINGPRSAKEVARTYGQEIYDLVVPVIVKEELKRHLVENAKATALTCSNDTHLLLAIKHIFRFYCPFIKEDKMEGDD